MKQRLSDITTIGYTNDLKDDSVYCHYCINKVDKDGYADGIILTSVRIDADGISEIYYYNESKYDQIKDTENIYYRLRSKLSENYEQSFLDEVNKLINKRVYVKNDMNTLIYIGNKIINKRKRHRGEKELCLVNYYYTT